MYWNSLAEFLAMGTHGPYVWGSFAVMAIAMVAEPLIVVGSRRKLVARLKRQYRAEQTERAHRTQRADDGAAYHSSQGQEIS